MLGAIIGPVSLGVLYDFLVITIMGVYFCLFVLFGSRIPLVVKLVSLVSLSSGFGKIGFMIICRSATQRLKGASEVY